MREVRQWPLLVGGPGHGGKVPPVHGHATEYLDLHDDGDDCGIGASFDRVLYTELLYVVAPDELAVRFYVAPGTNEEREGWVKRVVATAMLNAISEADLDHYDRARDERLEAELERRES
jgi:hypothetical protein